MILKIRRFAAYLLAGLTAVLLFNACASQDITSNRVEVKMWVGSALQAFCTQAADRLNSQEPKLQSGEAYYLTCEAQGSGDMVTKTMALAQQLRAGTLSADAPEWPTLLSVDGEIYQSVLIDRINQLFPGQNYIPAITDSPLLASSPMVFMAPADLAAGLRQTDDLFKTLVTAKTHRDIDAASQPLPVHYVQTVPTKSNSGLQTLVAQYASVSGKRPEQITNADVKRYTADVKAIQSKITRYGVSTQSLAQAMVKNGSFWASIGSVYESSVIAANTEPLSGGNPGQPTGQLKYEAIYPKATFSSNMRSILPTAPWVSPVEKAAAEQVIAYLQSNEAQQIAANLGLRPGTPGVALGAKFSPEFGVNPQAKYDSYRPPQPEVVEAMLAAWEQNAKKPSLVAIVVDSSGSMQGDKMPAVQSTLQNYITALTPQDRIALIDFDSAIRSPVLVDGSPEGQTKGIEFISSLSVEGGTSLYDASFYARNWLRKNLRPDAINAVLVLTDGQDTDSGMSLDQLATDLAKSGVESDQRISFFTVGYGNEGEFDAGALEKIAQATGGYYSRGDPESISRVMQNLQLEF
ncbi:MAG TPA: VWA domain-containing protein [Coleofasciculaceae cyanobacterium]|jgi:Ca-activated chloride channel family protein